MPISLPDNPTDGQTVQIGTIIYTYDATVGVWNSNSAVGPTLTPATVTTSDTAPSNPSNGDMWFDSSVGKTFIWYDDGTSTQWVQMNPNTSGGGSSDTGGESPIVLTEPPTTHTLNNDGTTSTLTMVAEDPEGFDITYGIVYKTTGNTRPAQLSADTTVDANGVYTFTPTTTGSDAGNFTARLSASDGAKTTTRLVDFSLAFAATVDYLVVAGGGAGGGTPNGGGCGGGGAGGYIYTTGVAFDSGKTFDITVGSGGTGSQNQGGNGEDSIISATGFTTVTAIGGGGGGGSTAAGADGGSGGGAAFNSSTFGNGTAGQGNDGGAGSGSNPYPGGGGGGAGAVGGSASGNDAGNGGDGLQNSITGTPTYYAGGGGGSGRGTGGTGGLGGGADGLGTGSNVSGIAGTANTGGGGSGAQGTGSGGDGGSGIVIIRTTSTATSTTGAPVVTTDGSYNIYSFTADGSITF